MDTDATGLPELTERQEKILSLIIREYTSRAEPVPSKLIAEQYLANLSSATIRNEMSRLEELGLLAAPHTSAGRVPTEAGYRYFVRRLLNDELGVAEKEHIAAEFSISAGDLEGSLKRAAVILARTAQGAALVTPPRTVSSTVKHIALLATHGAYVMLILVLHGGEVRQQLLKLDETPTQDQLSTLAGRLNSVCEGQNAEGLRARAKTLETELERGLIEVIADLIDGGENATRGAFQEGLAQILSEFTESEAVSQAVRAVSEGQIMGRIMAEATTDQIGEVRVLIGGDGRWQEVRHLGVVITRYGVQGQVTGMLAVLGPTRMRYGRAVSAVRYVAGLVSGLFYDTYKNE